MKKIYHISDYQIKKCDVKYNMDNVVKNESGPPV